MAFVFVCRYGFCDETDIGSDDGVYAAPTFLAAGERLSF